MKSSLDDIDNKILALLMDNARLPVTTIAKQVDIARTTVIARINALEKRGVIAGYGLKLNQEMFQPAVRAYVGLIGGGALRGRLNEISTTTAGGGDFVRGQRCHRLHADATLRPRQRCWIALLDQIGALDGVRQTSTSIILSKRIDRGAL